MIGNVLTELGMLSTVVWVATEGVGRLIKKPKPMLALLFGPTAGVVAYGSGLMNFGGAEGPWGWVASGFFGLVSTLGAAVAHNNLVKTPGSSE